jgi:hypothetical protein
MLNEKEEELALPGRAMPWRASLDQPFMAEGGSLKVIDGPEQKGGLIGSKTVAAAAARRAAWHCAMASRLRSGNLHSIPKIACNFITSSPSLRFFSIPSVM